MADDDKARQTSKISDQFASRLMQLAPNTKIRALLVLSADGADARTSGRQSRTERQEAIEAIRNRAQQSLSCVDGILEQFDGHRLAERPNALGAIPVETAVAGIFALANTECVRAILEDRNLALLNATMA